MRVMSASVSVAAHPHLEAQIERHTWVGRGDETTSSRATLHVLPCRPANIPIAPPRRFCGYGASALGDTGGQYSKQWLGAQWPARLPSSGEQAA